MQSNQPDDKRSDENVTSENTVQTPHNIKTDTPYYPVSILLHAYRQLNKAYQGNILFDTFSSEPHITSDNNAYENAAKKTLTDLQIAYTKGDLSEPLISALIAQRLPRAFTSDQPKSQGAELNLFRALDGNQKKSLELILKEIEKRSPSICTVQPNGQVNVSATSSHDFGVVYGILDEVRQHFRMGKTYSKNKVTNLVQNSFEDSHLVLSARSKRTEVRRIRDRENKNRVFTHEAVLLHEIDGVKLHMLAEHLLSRGKKDPFPFTALNKHLGFAKAVIDEGTGLAAIRLQTPVFKRDHEPQHQNRIQLLKSTIRDTAEYFYNTPNAIITQSIVADIAEKVKKFIKNPPHPVSLKDYEKQKRTFIKLEDLEEISHDDLFDTVEGLIYTHDTLTIDDIADNLNVDLDEPLTHSTLFMKLESLIDDLVDGGRLAKQDGIYKLPQEFNAVVELDVYPVTKKRDYVLARPIDWNEGPYGRIPEIILSEKQINQFNIKDGDRLTVQLDYHAGNVISLDIQDVTRTPRITTSKQDAEQASPNGIIPKVAIPADSILSGVVTEKTGNLYFTPSLEGLKPFALNNIDPSLFEGHIIKAKIDLSQGQVEAVVGRYGHISDNDGWSKLSALEAGLDLEFPEGILDGISLDIPKVSLHRKDFRDIPLITIDPETAKDFDDAIFVEENKNGWTVYVAIADVSHYVQPESALYDEALKRGTSVYLPDLTIPMLPEEISNNVCSLKPHEDRAAMVTTMQIDREGNIASKKTERGLINSVARLNYEQVQSIIEDAPDPGIEELVDTHIRPALNVYKALLLSRELRGALELDTPEQRIDISKDGKYKLRVDESNESHGIIEELMIANNRAAIQQLIEKGSPLIARVHGEPNERTFKEYIPRLSQLGVDVQSDSISLDDRVKNILQQAKSLADKDEITQIMVRVQDRAHYSSTLKDHYALRLEEYTHSTSPIRRITDLFVHYLTNDALGLKEGYTLPYDIKKKLADVALQASETERVADDVQRKSEQRVSAGWVEENLGEVFNATITHVSARGAHIKISEGDQEIRSIIPVEKFRLAVSGDVQSNAPYKPGSQVNVVSQSSNPITGVIGFSPA